MESKFPLLLLGVLKNHVLQALLKFVLQQPWEFLENDVLSTLYIYTGGLNMLQMCAKKTSAWDVQSGRKKIPNFHGVAYARNFSLSVISLILNNLSLGIMCFFNF